MQIYETEDEIDQIPPYVESVPNVEIITVDRDGLYKIRYRVDSLFTNVFV